MIIAIGCDHAGFPYKDKIIEHLKEKGHSIIDFGTLSEERCDYPFFAREVGYSVAKKEADLGVLICGSGEGIMIAANKVPGCKCGVGYNKEVTRLMREHNGCNAISFGARFMPLKSVLARLDVFLKSEPLGGRHLKRRNMIE